MITQGLFDFVADWLAGILGLLPPMPDSWTDAINGVSNGGVWLASELQTFGILVPWEWLGYVVQWYAGALILWSAVLVIRVVLYAFGR